MSRGPGLSLSVVLLAAACGDNLSVAPPTGPVTARATHYSFTFDLDSRAAHAQVSLTVETGGDCIALPVRAGLDASKVQLDGAPAASAKVDGGVLTACGPGWFDGDTVLLDADTTVALATLAPSQVGYSAVRDSDKNPYNYLVSWVGGCDQFAPCDNRPDQFATYTFAVTHAAGVTVRCPGVIDESDPTVTRCDFPYAGGPTYSTFGLIASSAWTQTDKGTWAGVHVTVYDRASTGIAAAIDPAYHTGYLAFMQREFGPYPFGGELRVLTAPTYWNGFEHPGNIVLADTLVHQFKPPYANNTAHTLDHEMTHMWAGDETTLADTYDFAWKESMAEYLPFTYEDAGSHAVGLITALAWKNDAVVAVHPPVPDDHPALIDFYTDVYGAGPMILFRQIEVMFSRDAVLAALRKVLGSAHAVSVDDVVAALSASTQTDLTLYAKAWLHGSGKVEWPRISLAYTPGAGSAAGSLAVHQTNQDQGVRGCVFHVALVGAGSGESTTVAVDTFHGGPDQTVAVPALAYAVTSTVLDPEHECLVYPAPAGLQREADRPRLWVAPRL